MNEVLKQKIEIINDESIQYDDYYKIFNTLRTVIALAVCPILGIIADFSTKCIQDQENINLKKLLIPGITWHSFYLIFSIFLFFDSLAALWIMMISGKS